MPRKPITFDDVRGLALKLPDVTESTMHGSPSLKVRGKLLACPALHKSADTDSLAVSIDLAERTQLLADSPAIFYVTGHYLKYQIVLVHLSKISQTALKKLLDQSWQFVTTKTKPVKTSKPR